MRFAVARQQGLTEDIAGLVDDGYEATELDERHKLAVAFTDAFLAATPPDEELQAALRAEFSDAEIVEMATAVLAFHAFSKMLIALGLEPEQMDTIVHATPGSAPR